MNHSTPSQPKILIAINDFRIGGAQRLICEELQAYGSAPFSVELLTLFQFPHEASFYDNVPAYVPQTRLSFKGFRDITSWFKLIKAIRASKPQIVISHLYFSNVVFRILKPFLGYKLIVVIQNTYRNHSRLQRMIDRILMPLSDRVVAVSRAVANFIIESEGIDASRVVVIHNSIDVERVKDNVSLYSREAILRGLYISPDEFVLFNAARLTDQKNHALLLEGFALFHTHVSHSKLLIAGEGSLEHTLKADAVRLGISDDVLFLGLVQDPTPYYAAADIFVSTSRIEGLSLAYLEAMAAGLPLVSTKTAGTDELIQDGINGFFIEAENPQSVEAALKKVYSALHKPDGRNMCTEAYKTAQTFDIMHHMKKLKKLIVEVMA